MKYKLEVTQRYALQFGLQDPSRYRSQRFLTKNGKELARTTVTILYQPVINPPKNTINISSPTEGQVVKTPFVAVNGTGNGVVPTSVKVNGVEAEVKFFPIVIDDTKQAGTESSIYPSPRFYNFSVEKLPIGLRKQLDAEALKVQGETNELSSRPVSWPPRPVKVPITAVSYQNGKELARITVTILYQPVINPPKPTINIISPKNGAGVEGEIVQVRGSGQGYPAKVTVNGREALVYYAQTAEALLEMESEGTTNSALSIPYPYPSYYGFFANEAALKFNDDGKATIVAKALDANGKVLASTSITVNQIVHLPPLEIQSFEVTPRPAKVNQNVTFSALIKQNIQIAQSLLPEDADDFSPLPLVMVAIDFGDGNKQSGKVGQNKWVHVYKQADDYLIKLTVTGFGTTVSRSLGLIVQDDVLPPKVTIETSKAIFVPPVTSTSILT